MTLRTTPAIATWVLDQFGAIPENDSAVGDLIEKYQRGRGTIWFWRQVLAIVFGGLYREVRRNTGKHLSALFRTWCVWLGLQVVALTLLFMRYHSLHPEGSDYGLAGNLMPLATFRVLTENHARVWTPITVLMVVLNVLTPLLVGRYIASSSRVHPRSLLLACLTAFVVADTGFIVTNLVLIYLNLESDIGFLITDLIALPMVPALLLIGGMRGLSPLSPKPRKIIAS